MSLPAPRAVNLTPTGGRLGDLVIEWFNGPAGGGSVFAPDPVLTGCTVFDREFRGALDATWAYAGGRFGPGGAVIWQLHDSGS